MNDTALPTPRQDWALFLDFDGCIVEIAPTPHSVEVPARLLPLLDDLRCTFGDAVAIVTGRSIAQIDDFFGTTIPAVAGLHGFERRITDGSIVRPSAPDGSLQNARNVLEEFAANHQGVFVEDKEFAVALHYRLNPELKQACRDAVSAAVAGITNRWQVVEGKCIFDIKPRSYTKGTAIEAFMAEPPFAGRIPVFCGDDVTDEDGFAAVNARGGISIRVGNSADTLAGLQVETVSELLDWLERIANIIRTASSTMKEQV